MSILTIILSALFFTILLLLRSHYGNKLNRAFGSIWDRKLGAFCPECKEVFIYSRDFASGEGTFYCPVCLNEFTPNDDSGIRLSYGGLVYLLEKKAV